MSDANCLSSLPRGLDDDALEAEMHAALADAGIPKERVRVHLVSAEISRDVARAFDAMTSVLTGRP